jgi:hypothetical protein
MTLERVHNSGPRNGQRKTRPLVLGRMGAHSSQRRTSLTLAPRTDAKDLRSETAAN